MTERWVVRVLVDTDVVHTESSWQLGVQSSPVNVCKGRRHTQINDQRHRLERDWSGADVAIRSNSSTIKMLTWSVADEEGDVS